MKTSAELTFLYTGWTVAIAVVAFVATAVCSYISWHRSGYRASVGVLEILRLSLVAIAGLLLNQPEWIEQYFPNEKPAIAVLWDSSTSMETRDVVRGDSSAMAMTRAEAIAPLLEDASWDSLREKMDITIQPMSSSSGQGSTNLYNPLLSTAEQIDNLTGVVIISDGDWNDGPPPVEAAARLRLQNVPIIALPVGSKTRLPDVELLSLNAPTFGVVGKTVRIPFSIESSLPREVTATVRLKVSDGQEVTKEIRIAPQGQTNEAILWKPDTLGDYNVTLEVPLQPQEAISENNTLTAPIAIREEKLNVLIVESVPRWEYRYLRNALSRDPGVEVACLLFHPGLSKVGGGNRDYIKSFPAGLSELSKFDVVLLGDVGVESGQLTSEQCDMLAGLVEQQASGLILLPGWSGRQFSLLETKLDKLYPVVMDESQPVGWGSRLPNAFALTSSGQSSLLTRLADTREQNIDVWDGLPGFQWYAPVVRAKAGTNVLCVHKEASNNFGRLPLLVTQTYGAGKVLFMGTDGAWRWRKGVEDKYHYRFWGQVVRWMAYQRNMAQGNSMRLYYSPDQPQLGQTTVLRANVMTAAGEPLSGGDVVATIVAPSGRTETIRFASTGDEWGAFSGSFVSKEPGSHLLTLSCAQTEATLESKLFVQGSAVEPVGHPAKSEVLEELARVTDGTVLQIDQRDEIIEYLASLPSPPPSVRRLQIWSHPATAAVVVLLLTCFWIARKVVGLI